jgi:hypothetical protein
VAITTELTSHRPTGWSVNARANTPRSTRSGQREKPVVCARPPGLIAVTSTQ